MCEGRALTLGVVPTWVHILASALPTCVALSQLFYISGPQLLHVLGGNKKLLLADSDND